MKTFEFLFFGKEKFNFFLHHHEIYDTDDRPIDHFTYISFSEFELLNFKV